MRTATSSFCGESRTIAFFEVAAVTKSPSIRFICVMEPSTSSMTAGPSSPSASVLSRKKSTVDARTIRGFLRSCEKPSNVLSRACCISSACFMTS